MDVQTLAHPRWFVRHAQEKLDSMNSEVCRLEFASDFAPCFAEYYFPYIYIYISLCICFLHVENEHGCCWCFFFGLMVRVVNVFFVSLEIFFLKLNSLNFWGFGQLEMENMVTVVYKLHQCIVPYRRVEMKILQWKTKSFYLASMESVVRFETGKWLQFP